MQFSDAFKRAVVDFFYLTNREYPSKGFLTMVSNRYNLNSTERTMLYRGIASTKLNIQRSEKLISFEETIDKDLFIDGFNILFTIRSYLVGKPLFISTDSILRDASVLKSKLIFDKTTTDAIVLLQQYLTTFIGSINIYLDQKVSFHQAVIDNIQLASNPPTKQLINFLVSNSVDKDLASIENGVVVTSDSEIIDGTECRVFDLPHHLLKEKFRPEFIDLTKFR